MKFSVYPRLAQGLLQAALNFQCDGTLIQRALDALHIETLCFLRPGVYPQHPHGGALRRSR